VNTTQQQAQVAQRDPSPHASAIVARLLKLREQYVPAALNGQPKKSPSIFEARASQIRKDMQQEKSAEVLRLLTVFGDLIASGVPEAVVQSLLDDMSAYVTLCAGDVANEPRDLAVLVRAETKAQGRLDLAQLALLERPTDPAVIEECVRAAGDYETRYSAFVRNLHARLAFLRGHTKPTMEVAR
jgi:hypothetical protein